MAAATANGTTTASPDDQLRAAYERAESSAASAFEDLVSKPSFGRLLTAHSGRRRGVRERAAHDGRRRRRRVDARGDLDSSG
jgi:hypothetical protein